MLRPKYLLKLLPATRTQSLQFNISQRPGKFYSTSITRFDKTPTDNKNDKIPEEPQQQQPPIEEIKENTTATQIDIRSSQTGMIEGSRINHYLKKKEIGMTDDESTIKGKVAAKTKDFTAFIFAGGAAIALGYALYVLYNDYFAKKPEDYAFENAEKVVANHPSLENALGVNFTVSATDKSGRRRFGSGVEHEPAQKLPDMGDHVECMTVNLHANTKTRKCLVQALMIKREEEPASEYTPLLIYGITDYDKKHYAKKVMIMDYRSQMKAGIDIIRQAHELYLNKISSETEIKFEREKKPKETETITAFGDLTSSKSTISSSSTPTKNFADSGTSSKPQTSDSNSNSEDEKVRVRPKF